MKPETEIDRVAVFRDVFLCGSRGAELTLPENIR